MLSHDVTCRHCVCFDSLLRLSLGFSRACTQTYGTIPFPDTGFQKSYVQAEGAWLSFKEQENKGNSGFVLGNGWDLATSKNQHSVFMWANQVYSFRTFPAPGFSLAFASVRPLMPPPLAATLTSRVLTFHVPLTLTLRLASGKWPFTPGSAQASLLRITSLWAPCWVLHGWYKRTLKAEVGMDTSKEKSEQSEGSTHSGSLSELRSHSVLCDAFWASRASLLPASVAYMSSSVLWKLVLKSRQPPDKRLKWKSLCLKQASWSHVWLLQRHSSSPNFMQRIKAKAPQCRWWAMRSQKLGFVSMQDVSIVEVSQLLLSWSIVVVLYGLHAS